MLEVAGQFFKSFNMLLGDALMAKWTAAFQLWYRVKVEADMKKKVDEQYDILKHQWDSFQGDRP